jgi:hypothetical protein
MMNDLFNKNGDFEKNIKVNHNNGQNNDFVNQNNPHDLKDDGNINNCSEKLEISTTNDTINNPCNKNSNYNIEENNIFVLQNKPLDLNNHETKVKLN